MDRHGIRWIALLLFLGILGLATFLNLYTEAFPIAALDFKLSREEALQQAQDYLEGLGYSTAGYTRAQILGHDQEAQIFLEQELGLEEANRLVREWVSIWSWRVRWFKSLEKEELKVGLDPGGRIVNFDHLILESDEGANLEEEEARPVAEKFLQEKQGFDLADYELIERSSEARKARIDHTFTFRKRGFVVGEDGHYRLEVVVKGDQVGRFREYLKVPEAFSRNYREVRSRADLLTNVASIFWIGLGVMMLVVLVQKYRQGVLQWQTGLLVGGVVLVASFAGQVNSLPLIRFNYETTLSFTSFIVLLLAAGLLSAIFSGGIIALVGTAGGALGREVLFAGKRSPLGRLSLSRVFSPGLARSVFAGYGLAFAMLGYVTLFYIVGSRYFGVWSPATVVDYDNAFSTAIPWIYPLLVGLVAATMEEFFFRLLAIPLLLRWFGRRWLAILLPAVVWAFLHSNYPVEPIYTRGIEISIVGIALGLVFLRFGIWSTVIAHYAFNAFQVAFPMLKSSSLYFQVSGIAVIGLLLLPAIPALLGFLSGRQRQLEEEEEEEEVATPMVETPPPEPAPGQQLAQKGPEAYLLKPRHRLMAGLFALAGLALAIGLRVEKFGERTLSLAVTRPEAVARATEFCGEIDLDLQGYRRTAWFGSHLGSDPYVHLVRQTGVARADTLATQETAPWIWYVRWFKPEEKEEIQVGVDAAGRIAFFDHQLPESQAGAEWPADRAREKVDLFAERHFARVVRDTLRFKLLEERAEKREARTDHHFVWERVDRKVEDGEFRTETRLQGDQVGYLRQRYKAPEEFLRELNQTGVKDIIPIVVVIGVGLATLILGGIYFFRVYREGGIRWGFPVRIGILLAMLTLVDKINELPMFFRNYDTSQALGTFLGMQAIGLLLPIVSLGLGITVIAALGLALLRKLHPGEMEPAQWFGMLRQRAGGGNLWLDVILLGVMLGLIGRGLGELGSFVEYRWLSDYLKPGGFSPSGLNTYLPLLSGITSALGGIILLPAGLAGLLIWQKALRRTWVLVLGFGIVMVLITAVAPAEDLYHFSFLMGLILVRLAAMAYVIVRVVRFNLMAYMVLLWAGGLIGSGWGLVETADLFYQINGAVMLVLGLAPLALPLIAHLKAARSQPSLAS